MTVNVALELFDHKLLFADDRFDEIADRYDADDGLIFQDR